MSIPSEVAVSRSVSTRSEVGTLTDKRLTTNLHLSHTDKVTDTYTSITGKVDCEHVSP